MEARIIAIFCEIYDLIKSKNIKDDKQVTMSMSEIMTLVVAAGEYFGGNLEKVRAYFIDQNYVKNMLSKSQLNRRMHAIKDDQWMLIYNHLAEYFKQENISKESIADSFSVESCHLVRSNRRKLFKEKEYVGFKSAKKDYFVGLKVHMLMSITRKPLEMAYSPASYHDLYAFKQLQLSLPSGSIIYADKAYNDYELEDKLLSEKDIMLLPIRKDNSTKLYSPTLTHTIKRKRKNVETGFSSLTSRFPKSIHAVTERGFKLKVFSFILAYAFSCLF
ncbi:MAG: IS982 family transposase [Candidatus Babeliaceae bacterium]